MINSFINWVSELIGVASPVWPKACKKIESMMITPFFVYKDRKKSKKQAELLSKSDKYNSICGLVDLQEGRNYIISGRNATKLEKQCVKNIRTALDNGLTPVLIIRNDWAVRNKIKQRIPSVDGPAPSNQADFYSTSFFDRESKFLESLKWLFPYIHIQVNIEPEHPASADFANSLSIKLRSIGFKNKIIVNPYGKAVSAHSSIKGHLDSNGVSWGRSWHSMSLPPDPIWNTDGNTNINRGTIKNYYIKIKNSGREYIIWSQEMANNPDGIPSEYL